VPKFAYILFVGGGSTTSEVMIFPEHLIIPGIWKPLLNSIMFMSSNGWYSNGWYYSSDECSSDRLPVSISISSRVSAPQNAIIIQAMTLTVQKFKQMR